MQTINKLDMPKEFTSVFTDQPKLKKTWGRSNEAKEYELATEQLTHAWTVLHDPAAAEEKKIEAVKTYYEVLQNDDALNESAKKWNFAGPNLYEPIMNELAAAITMHPSMPDLIAQTLIELEQITQKPHHWEARVFNGRHSAFSAYFQPCVEAVLPFVKNDETSFQKEKALSVLTNVLAWDESWCKYTDMVNLVRKDFFETLADKNVSLERKTQILDAWCNSVLKTNRKHNDKSLSLPDLNGILSDKEQSPQIRAKALICMESIYVARCQEGGGANMGPFIQESAINVLNDTDTPEEVVQQAYATFVILAERQSDKEDKSKLKELISVAEHQQGNEADVKKQAAQDFLNKMASDPATIGVLSAEVLVNTSLLQGNNDMAASMTAWHKENAGDLLGTEKIVSVLQKNYDLIDRNKLTISSPENKVLGHLSVAVIALKQEMN